MPSLSQWMIRASLLYLGVGFTLGALILFDKGVPYEPDVWRFLPLHIEMLILGWMVQLAMGVAYWILPRFGTQRRKIPFASLGFMTLNLGILLVGIGTWQQSWIDLAIVGRIAELGAATAFVVHAWPRVKAPGVR
jgi:hypothetical protein